MAARIALQTARENGLALALVVSSSAPLVLLAGDLSVVAASASFCDAFQIDPAGACGHPLFELGAGEWDVPPLRALLRATADGYGQADAYEMDLRHDGAKPRRLVVTTQKLDYGDADNVRVLMTVADVTDARLAAKLKDDLLREKAILLQEVQHRVANSLQIIASVILQSAKRVHSNVTRDHLYDAHNRVMSVAAVQQQLAASRLGEVVLRPYFTDLCHSIGASMIRDPKQLSLAVDVDDSATTADISVSLGLIVTELVINALKHAFPGGRNGKIVVGYHSEGDAWTMSVCDDGVGMPKDAASAKPGLGTSIVEALANQLGAVIEVSSADPGVAVSLFHRTISAGEVATSARPAA